MKKRIVIKTQFAAIHEYPDCNIKSVLFLKNPHRHIFHVTIKFEVNHNNRDIEFIDKKMQIEKDLQEHFHNKNLGTRSCEDIAEEILTEYGACFVSVFEDNENGAEVAI